MANARFSAARLDDIAAEFQRDGFSILPGHFSAEILSNWQNRFRPLLMDHIEHHGDPSFRGANRYYVTLPFAAPFADPKIYEDDDILALVERIVGQDFVMCQLATDSPTLGSDFQPIHGDARPLFPESKVIPPPFQLALNFPLVDVTAENGPLEITRGTHMIPKEEGLAKIASGEIKIEKIEMKLGDVMIRDVRGLHRGTPNRTETPRPMAVIGYSRAWFRRPEVNIQIPRKEFEKLSPRARHMLRYEPVIEELTATLQPETYKAFAY